MSSLPANEREERRGRPARAQRSVLRFTSLDMPYCAEALDLLPIRGSRGPEGANRDESGQPVGYLERLSEALCRGDSILPVVHLPTGSDGSRLECSRLGSSPANPIWRSELRRPTSSCPMPGGMIAQPPTRPTLNACRLKLNALLPDAQVPDAHPPCTYKQSETFSITLNEPSSKP